MQRLFSMFPNGWPGAGLLLLRLTDCLLLLRGFLHRQNGVQGGDSQLTILSSLMGVFVLLGLWTPAAGLLLAATETVLLLRLADDPWILGCLVCVNLAIAMLGPGVLSIDAAIFGRQRLELPDN